MGWEERKQPRAINQLSVGRSASGLGGTWYGDWGKVSYSLIAKTPDRAQYMDGPIRVLVSI